jgi:hypothetical protein
MLIKVVVNNVAVALQQDNSYKKQNYTEHHASIYASLPPKRKG